MDLFLLRNPCLPSIRVIFVPVSIVCQRDTLTGMGISATLFPLLLMFLISPLLFPLSRIKLAYNKNSPLELSLTTKSPPPSICSSWDRGRSCVTTHTRLKTRHASSSTRRASEANPTRTFVPIYPTTIVVTEWLIWNSPPRTDDPPASWC